MTQLEQVCSVFSIGIPSVIEGTTGSRELLIACEKGLVDDVKYYLENGVDVNENYNTGSCFWDDNHSYLMVASMWGHVDVVKELCTWYTDMDARDIHGNTAFMLAIWDEQIDVAKELLRQGSDWAAVNHEGKTGLDFLSDDERDMMEEFIIDLEVEKELENSE